MFEQFNQGGWTANDESPDEPVFDKTSMGKVNPNVPF
jgi:hypothetical protein